MTKQEIRECYGKSVYEIWLEVAMRSYDGMDALGAFEAANYFVAELMARELKEGGL